MKTKFIHVTSGAERWIRELPNEALRERGLSHHSFQTSVPYYAFPDKSLDFGKPGMPILQTSVRCCRKHHKIVVWPDGRLTLTAHRGKRAQKAMKVARAMGQKYRCMDVLENYRLVCEGSYLADRKALPKELREIADQCYQIRERRNRVSQSSRFTRTLTLSERMRDRRDSMTKAYIKTLTDQDHSYACPLWNISTGRASQWQRHQNKLWFRKALLSGILGSKLSRDGINFFPTIIPDHVLDAGYGYIPANDSKGNPYWIMIERTGEQFGNSHRGMKPKWEVSSFYQDS